MNFLQSLAQQFAVKPIDWEELEEALIRADFGVPMTMRIIKTLQEHEAWSLLGIGDVIKAVREETARILPPDPAPIHRAEGKPTRSEERRVGKECRYRRSQNHEKKKTHK